jgi:hypothetical protein
MAEARADQDHTRQLPASAHQAEHGLAAKPRGSNRPHGFPIGDHALPASWAACGCKFVHVLEALLTIVGAPSSIPLDMEHPGQVFVSGTIDASRYPARSPMATFAVGVPLRCPDDANAAISRCQKRFFPIETPFAAVARPRTRPVASVPTQGDDNWRDDHV